MFGRPRGRPRKVLTPEEQKVEKEFISQLHEDMQMYSEFEQLNQTSGGQRLIKLLSDSIDDTTKHWFKLLLQSATEVTGESLLKQFCLIKSKHDTLRAFEGKIKDATNQKLEIEKALLKLTEE